MYFKRLEMHGFKSFADPVVIEFHEGVTCVVGPNGSGKSNISDAIRWVLGEQSPKTLRGGKMEEVIFAGTANRKMRGMAEVNLVIDNSSGILDIDYSEVSITRRMFRSGDSEYLINNVPCRLKDIRELIMDTGIGVDGYSIIGQGKIADIVSNKPESRREIFEEAAGVVAYKTKKLEAERKLESTEANLERANDIVGELEARLPGLKEDSEKALEYLKLRKAYEDLEINIITVGIENIRKKQEVFHHDIEELTGQISSSEEDAREVSKNLESAQHESSELELRGSEAHNKLLSVIEKHNQIINRDRVKEEKLSAIDRDEVRLRNELENLKVSLNEENYALASIENDFMTMSEKLSSASDKLASKQEEHQIILEKKHSIDREIDDDRESLFNFHRELASKNSELKSLETLRQTLRSRKVELQLEWDRKKDDDFQNKSKLAEAEAQSEEWSKKKAFLQETELNQKKEISHLTDDRARLLNSIKNLTLKESKLTARKKTIEEMEANYEGYNYGVKYIMKSQAKGLDGVVAELMKVPEGYETAIETALGGSLQNIVCRSEDDAKAAIDLLKRNNAGRITFLPLTRINGQIADVSADIRSDSEFIGIGSELVKCHDEYKGIFRYLLGKTAVVNTIDSAIRLSKKSRGIRFVTLSGEVINPAGAMSGGRYKNKTSNLIERRSEIGKLENEIAALLQEVNFSEGELSRVESEIQRLQSSIEENGKLIKEAELRTITLDEKLTYLRAVASGSEESKEKFQRQIISIDDDLKDSDSIIEELRGAILESEHAVEAITSNSLGKTREQDALGEQLTSVAEIVTELMIDKNQYSANLENINNQKRRIEKSIETLEKAIETNGDNLLSLKKSRADLMDDSGDDLSNLGLLEGEKANLEDLINTIKYDKEEILNKISKLTKHLGEINRNLISLKEQKYQLEVKAAKGDTQEETLLARLWDEFEMSFAQALDRKSPDFAMSSSVKINRDIKKRLRELGDVNVGSIKEYEELSKRYDFLVEQRKDIIFASDELKRIIHEMSTAIKERFKENFDKVVVNFSEIFTELFGGGIAQLRLENEENPLESGIEIVAQPPGKKLQNLNLMSGGEKTMTAIALMFAVLKAKPTPFCILDEVEAALDDANIDRFSNYLRNFEKVQFVLVTHQRATMEHADVLYGVTMAEQGISKLLSLKLGDEIEL